MAVAENPLPANDVQSLPSLLDAAAAQSLKDLFCDLVASRRGVVLDGEKVERISTSAVQILLAAAKAFAAEDRSFAMTRPSQALRAGFSDLGLSKFIDQWGRG